MSTALIDCDTDPRVPDNMFIVDHLRGGQIQFHPDRLRLHVVPPWTHRVTCARVEIWRTVKALPVVNACVFDHLLANPHTIPEGWKVNEDGRTLYISFIGTLYGDMRSEYLYVRMLSFCQIREEWRGSFSGVGDNFGSRYPVVLLD